MKNIRLFVEFPIQDAPVEWYAIAFTGVMTRRHIYAKRASDAGNLNYIEAVKIARNDTQDITSDVRSMWKVIHRSIDVTGDINDEERITINPELPLDILQAIESALEEEKLVHSKSFQKRAS